MATFWVFWGKNKLTLLYIPTNSLYTPMDNTPLHSISSVCHPWGDWSGRTRCCQVRATMVSLPHGCHLLAYLSKYFVASWVRTTPTQPETEIFYTVVAKEPNLLYCLVAYAYREYWKWRLRWEKDLFFQKKFDPELRRVIRWRFQKIVFADDKMAYNI